MTKHANYGPYRHGPSTKTRTYQGMKAAIWAFLHRALEEGPGTEVTHGPDTYDISITVKLHRRKQ